MGGDDSNFASYKFHRERWFRKTLLRILITKPPMSTNFLEPVIIKFQIELRNTLPEEK
jgi:hypothetical protein